jgi:hypothetical protein
MKHEAEFRSYLTTVRKSSKTGKAYAPKVVTDMLRRCRKVEALLRIELSQAISGSSKGLEDVCETIRQSRLTSTPTMPYAHLSLINAVRIYADFFALRQSI